MNAAHCCCVFVLLSLGMALIKGLNGIYSGKRFCLLQTGKWALKPNSPQPTPHVGRTGLAAGGAVEPEQTTWLDKKARLLWKLVPDWPLPDILQRTWLWCVWCVLVVNSFEQFMLIPRSVVVKKRHLCWLEGKNENFSGCVMNVFCQPCWILFFLGRDSNIIYFLNLLSLSVGTKK